VIERSGPLTAAQRRMWLRSYWRGHGELFPGWVRRWDLTGHDIDVAGARRAFAGLALRHEILRTRFEIGPDGDPMQVVLAADDFRLPLSVLPAATADDPEHSANAQMIGVRTALPLWSVRLFVDGDRVRQVVLEFDHILSDGTGLRTWYEQFLALAAGDEVAAPDKQPLDHAETEPGAPDDLALPNSGVDLRAPQVLATAGALPEGPRYVVTRGRFEGLLPVLDAATAVSPASRSQLLTVVLATVLARFADVTGVHVSTYIADRERGDRGIECRMRPINLVLDLDPDRTIAATLRAACLAALGEYARDLRDGAVSPDLRALAAAARGQAAIVPMFVNYQATVSDPPTLASVEPRLEITDEWDCLGRAWSSMMWIYVTGDVVTLEFDVDAAMLPVGFLHEAMTRLPAVLEHIAARPDAPLHTLDEVLGPQIVAAAPRLARVGGSWANLAALEAVLRTAPGVSSATCRVADERVVAELGGAGVVPFDVHEHVLAALQEHLDVTAPARYVLTDGQAVDVAAGWPELAPTTVAERELAAALHEVLGADDIDLTQTYLGSGGRLLRSPAVVEVLARRGWTGLGSRHFTAPVTLRSVARDLRRAADVLTDRPVYLP